MEIRPLRLTDERSVFRSGDSDLDNFFARYAGQNQFRHHVGTTFVAIEGDKILGYATVAAGQVEGEKLPVSLRRNLPQYPLPVLRLGRLAVDSTAQERGVGKALLRYVFHLAVRMSGEVGCIGIVVDAKPGSVGFYARFGFSPLEAISGKMESRPEPQPLFLPLRLIQAVLAKIGQ
jgi:predicted N-acetyltransferase YhbS